VIEALIKAGAFDGTGAMRKALQTALDRALSTGAATQRDRQAGQLNMFDVPGVEAPTAPIDLSGEEWTEAEMLAHEKSVLGFYVTSHPLTREAEFMRRFATADCADLERLGDRTDVVVAGMVSRMRTVASRGGRKPGSKLAVLTFEDLTGSIEAVVYSEELDRCREHVGPDQLLFLRGTVDRRREAAALRVSEVIPMDEGPARLAEAVILNAGRGIEPAAFAQVRDVCRRHPGDRPLFLRLSGPDQTALLRCDADCSVRPGDGFRREVEALLGEGTVEIVGPRKPPVISNRLGAERGSRESPSSSEPAQV
jgi:DNA polymerase-3 subunit alpha